MALVELREVSKIYRVGDEEIRALDCISLDIEPGEFISIVGPSGSGKSTLMHILGCLDSPTQGTINLDGVMRQIGGTIRFLQLLGSGVFLVAALVVFLLVSGYWWLIPLVIAGIWYVVIS